METLERVNFYDGSDRKMVFEVGQVFSIEEDGKRGVYVVDKLFINPTAGYFLQAKFLFGEHFLDKNSIRIFSYNDFEDMVGEDQVSFYMIHKHIVYDLTRIPRFQLTAYLETILEALPNTTIRGKTKGQLKRYALSPEEIGYPDWIVKFKTSDRWTLAKISALTNEFSGKVFLRCHNAVGFAKFKDSSSMFYSLSGFDIHPSEVAKKLQNHLDAS
jgi:hypothetical protein